MLPLSQRRSNSGAASTSASAGPMRQRMVAVSVRVVEISARASMAVSAPRSTSRAALLPSSRARSRGCGSTRLDSGMLSTMPPSGAVMLAVAILSSHRKAPGIGHTSGRVAKVRVSRRAPSCSAQPITVQRAPAARP